MLEYAPYVEVKLHEDGSFMACVQAFPEEYYKFGRDPLEALRGLYEDVGNPNAVRCLARLQMGKYESYSPEEYFRKCLFAFGSAHRVVEDLSIFGRVAKADGEKWSAKLYGGKQWPQGIRLLDDSLGALHAAVNRLSNYASKRGWFDDA